MEQLHKHKWAMYAAIILLTVVVGWFIISFISNVALDKNREKQEQIEVLKKESTIKADSIARVIEVEKKAQTQTVESLAKRVEAVNKTAAIEKKALLKQYEKAFKEVVSITDDSIAILDRCNRSKYDSLFRRYNAIGK